MGGKKLKCIPLGIWNGKIVMSQPRSTYSRECISHRISEILGSGRPLPEDMEVEKFFNMSRNMPNEILHFQSGIVSKSLALNPLIAERVYKYLERPEHKKMLIDSMIRGMEGVDFRDVLRKLLIRKDRIIDSYDLSLIEDFLTSLMVQKNIPECDVKRAIERLKENLSVYMANQHREWMGYSPAGFDVNVKGINYLEIEQEVISYVERGEDPQPIYERLADEVMKRDELISFIGEDQSEDFIQNYRQRVVDYISKCYQKDVVRPYLPSFKEETMRIVNELLDMVV
jgi:hypothetical protein